MSALARLQRQFQQCLLKGAPHSPPGWISPAGRARPGVQLAVYAHAYRARLHETLESDFPALAAILGADGFAGLADRYIDAHPSGGYSLRSFGARLPDYLAAHPPGGPAGPLPELARFEWALAEAFDAADDPVATEQAVASLPPDDWPDLTLVFHASLHRLDFSWNVPALWKALTGDEPPSACREPQPVAWLVWRQALITRFRSLAPEEALALDTARRGADFGELCEALTTVVAPAQVPLRAASMLKGWMGAGLVSHIGPAF